MSRRTAIVRPLPPDEKGIAVARNDQFFDPPLVTETFLAVRGFDKQGRRSGGIVDPVVVEIPARTVLFRLYHDPNRRPGEWWFTPYEMKQVIDYFGLSATGFTTGRAEGKSILHATLAVRHDWAGNSPRHLDQFVSIRLNEPLKAYYGEADHAPDAGHTDMQKAYKIIDANGRQRAVRQVYIPKLWTYRSSFTYMSHHPTDTVLVGAVERHRRAPLPFET